MAFLVEAAGGTASDGKNRILTIEPRELHQRTPVFMGSPDDVADALRFARLLAAQSLGIIWNGTSVRTHPPWGFGNFHVLATRFTQEYTCRSFSVPSTDTALTLPLEPMVSRTFIWPWSRLLSFKRRS